MDSRTPIAQIIGFILLALTNRPSHSSDDALATADIMAKLTTWPSFYPDARSDTDSPEPQRH
jgi:hypothetical protein